MKKSLIFWLAFLLFWFNLTTKAQTTLFLENFEGPTYAVTPGGTPAWNTVSTLQVSGTYSYQNQIALNDSSWFVTDPIDLTGYSYVILEFWHICKIEFFDAAEIFISIDDGNTWTKLTTEYIDLNNSTFVSSGYKFTANAYPTIWLPAQHTAQPDNTWWQKEQFNVSAVAGNQANVRFRFRMRDGNGNGANGNAGWFIDDIRVFAATHELDPPQITLVPPILQDTIFDPGAYTIRATITDATGILGAYFCYNINSAGWDSIPMTLETGNTYMVEFPGVGFNKHVDYYISAKDATPTQNYAKTINRWFYTKKVQTVQIGNGTSANGTTVSPTPYGTYYKSRRQQYLVLASELQAAGMTAGTQITSIAFEVQNVNNCSAMPNYTIRLKHTTATALTSTFDNSGYTTVWTHPNFLPVNGWNTHTFNTPFTWDGSSNLLIDLCSDLIPGSYTQNASVFFHTTTFNSAAHAQSDSSPMCLTSNTATTSSNRANIRFGMSTTQYQRDISISQVISPSGNVDVNSPAAVIVRMKNNGTDTITSATIHASINNVPQTPYAFSGTLIPDVASTPINIGSFNFNLGNNILKVWTENPNGLPDQNPSNDTLTVNIYGCPGFLSGTYTIDSSQPEGGTNFASIQSALNALNNCGVVGPVTFELHDPEYNLEMILGEIPGASATNTITFRPAPNTNVVITSASSTATIRLNAAKHIIFDGSSSGPGSRNLTIRNNSTSANTAAIWLSSTGSAPAQACQNVTIKNCIIEAGSNTVATFGIYLAGTSISTTGAGHNHNNILIENNHIRKCRYGIYANGTSPNFISNLNIHSNEIGSNTSSEYVILRGIHIQNTTQSIITKNYIHDMRTTEANTIAAIHIDANVSDLQITKNRIHSIHSTSSSGYGAYGINIGSSTGTNNILIANNFISDIITSRYSTTSTIFNPFGIRIVGGSNIKIYHNSINLYGEPTTGSSASMSACLVVTAAVTNLDVRNNIFANSMTGLTGSKSYCVHKASAVNFATIDNNNYYPSGPYGLVGYSGTADVATLSGWQTVTGQDQNSVNINPAFVGNDDLHTFNILLNGLAQPLADVPDDIDDEPRDPANPDIGADEFDPLNYDIALISIDHPSTAPCNLTQNEYVQFTIQNLGTQTITSFDASIFLNNQLVVQETFSVNIPSLSTQTMTFTQPINLQAPDTYQMTLALTLSGDPNASNDTLRTTIRHSHDFYAGAYTMSFEANEPYQDWTIFNGDNSQFRWQVPFVDPAFARTGTSSARFFNGTSNTGEDWLFTRCFDLQAGKTYRISFWYRTTSTSIASAMQFYVGTNNTPSAMTTLLLNLTNLLNTTYQEATITFVPSTTGVYYFGWKATSAASAIHLLLDDINIELLPDQEAEITAILEPVDSDCDLTSQNVTLVIRNNGLQPITSIDASYQRMDLPNIITETFNINLAPNQFDTLTFSTPVDLSTSVTTTYTLRVWISLADDPLQYNDTLAKTIQNIITPPIPTVQNDTIQYGQMATLVASSTANIIWTSDSALANIIHIGDTFSIGPLYTDTTFWVYAAHGSMGTVQLGTGTTTTSTTGITPFSSNYEGVRIQYLIRASELQALGMQAGRITSLAFNVTSSGAGTYAQNGYTIKLAHTTATEFSGAYLNPTGSWTTVYYNAAEPAPPVGWKTFTFSTPFLWDGQSNILIDICHENDPTGSCGACFSSNSTVQFTTTTFNSVYGRYNDNAPACNVNPSLAISTFNQRPNIRFDYTSLLCPSTAAPISAIVIPPDVELNLLSIISPEDKECSPDVFNVTIRFVNKGLQPADSIIASYIALGDTVYEIISAPLAPYDTLIYTFNTPLTIPSDTLITLLCSVSHPADPYLVNNSLQKQVRLGITPPTPIVTGDTVFYGQQATLTAQSTTNVFWFSDPNLTSLVHIGDTFVTPPLLNDQTYWVYAANVQPPSTYQFGTATTTTSTSGITPFTSFYEGARIQYLILASEMLAAGMVPGQISSLAFNVTASGPGTYPQLNYTIKMAHTNVSSFSGAFINPTTWQTVYFNASEPAPPVGWKKFTFSQPFDWDGISNIVIDICHENDPTGSCGACYSSNSSVQFTTTPFNSVYGRYNDNAPACDVNPSSAISTFNQRPNIRFELSPAGCPSDTVSVTAVVLPPQVELKLISIVQPSAEECSNNANNVVIRFVNTGTDTAYNVVASYAVNNGPAIIDTLNFAIAPYDTITYTFSTPIALNLTTGSLDVTIQADVSHPQDTYLPNNTLTKVSKFFYVPPMPTVQHDTIPYGTQATLSATSAYELNWYTSPTSQTPIHTGNIYTTPVLYASTPYYVAAQEGTTANVGPANNTIGTGGYVNYDTYRLFFDVLSPSGVTIQSVNIYPQESGQPFTIQILDNASNVIASYSGTTTVTQPHAQTVPVNFTIPQGNNYAMKFASGMPNMYRNTAGASFPYVLPGIIQITGHSFTGYPEYYYYFYNWSISTGSPCESDRAEVWAVIDQNTIPDHDAGILSIVSPADTIDYSTHDIIVTLKNFGTQPLTSVTIEWSVNNVLQTPFAWTGNLTTGQTQSNILLGSMSFPFGPNIIKAWTSNPNGQIDPTPQNDTATKVVFAAEPLCGIYTIGGPSADFATFSDAISALDIWGISCPVTFIVNDGTYNEQITIENIFGTNDSTTITFRGNSTNAILTFASNTSNARHTLLLNGARHIRFENITIESDASASFGWAVHLMNNCYDIVFRDCIIRTNDNTSTTSNYVAFVANGSASTALTTGNAVHKLLLQNNTIIGGYYGILIYGSTTPRLSDIQIVGNIVRNQYYYGMYLYNMNSPLITQNTVIGRTSGSTTTSSYGMYLYNVYPPYTLTKNIVRNWGIYGIYISAASTLSSTTPTLIANNMIGGGFTSTSTSATGLYVSSLSNIAVYYNSINMDGQAGRGVQFLSSATQIDYRNNSVAFTGGGAGYAEYSPTPSNFTQRNYNNYFSNGSNFVYYGLNRPTLASLQAVNIPAGNDLQSKSGNPMYLSATDLHATGLQLFASATPLAQVQDDIDNEPRHPVTPCIGADEYTPANIDLAVTALVAPQTGCGISSSEPVTITIQNLGLDTVYSFYVSYSINGSTPVTDTVNTTLATGHSTNYTFTQTADLSATGTYQFTITVEIAGDAIPANNTLSATVKNGFDFYTSNYTMGFEANEDFSQWTVIDVDNNGYTWQPGYTGYAHTGSRSARFYNSSTNTGGDYLFTECFYLEAQNTYKIEFWYRAESVNYPQNIDLVVATNVIPLNLLPGGTLLQLQNFNNTTYQKAEATFTPPVNGVYYFGWYAYSTPSAWYCFIDNINIRLLPPYDVAAISIASIPTYKDANTTDTVKVKIRNLGSNTITSLPISYSINNSPWITETWTGTLVSEDSLIYTFNTPVTIPEGWYTLCVRTELPNDFNPLNDQVCTQKFGIPTFTVPFTDNFEGPVYWYAPDVNTQWQHGVPNASVINTAYSPQNVWTTNLTGNYNNNITYYLYTPKFDFSQSQNMYLGFWHWYETEQNADGGRVEYSPNNGVTWFTLGTYNDPNATNWYNTQNIGGKPAFSGNSNGWVYSEIPLSIFNNYQNPVQFRFVFFANASVNYNGWAIDDFIIYQPQLPYDAGVVEIISPVGQSITGGPNTVTVRIENFGTQTLTSIPVRYQIQGAPPVQETWTGTLAPGNTTTYTFNQPFIGPFVPSYQFCSWTALTGDIYSFNDSTCITLQQGPANIDGGVIAILQPTQPLVAGQQYTVQIRIQNFGLQPISNFPVQYFINGNIQATEIVQTTLQPNQTHDFTFFTQFTAPSSTYADICARTIISGDVITNNNETCTSLTVGITEYTSENGFILFQNIPNPTDNITYIPFYLPFAGQCTFTITNVLGQPVYTETRSFDQGMNTIEFNAKQLRAGVYYYSVTFDQITLTRMMVIH